MLYVVLEYPKSLWLTMGPNSSHSTSKTSARNEESSSPFLLHAIQTPMGKWSRPTRPSSRLSRSDSRKQRVFGPTEPPLVPQQETSFSLAYNTEAVIPVECDIPSTRYMWLNKDTNQELLSHNLDAINKLHDKAHLCTAFYQQKVAHHTTTKTSGWEHSRLGIGCYVESSKIQKKQESVS